MNSLIHPEVASKILPAKSLVVLLHGLGSDGHDLIGLVPSMKNDLPKCHFFAPHGVEAYDQAPYGRQWFSLQDQTPQVMQQLLENNIAPLVEIIKQKQKELCLTNEDTIIMGFSQGAMMGLYLTLIQEAPFLCMIGFAGLLLIPSQCVNKTTPVCLIHGELDQVIPVEAMDHTIQYLAKYHIPYDGYRLPGLAHSIDDRGLGHAINFIKKVI